jgi:hypothetical protein
MKDPKFFIGPMTQNVIDAVIEVANETNETFGFITSRRQIDYTGGYVGYNTRNFIKYVKSKTNNVLLCRDHGGIGQGELLTATPHIYNDNTSFKCDAAWCMDIIHIDPWKFYYDWNNGFMETFNNIILINSLNYLVKFEIGTEEAIRAFNDEEFYKLLYQLKYELGNDIFKKNIKYAVIQSGTRLQGTKNIGHFNIERLKSMNAICKEFDILSKEHNGDYLTDEELKIRFDNGLDAINIAPEFGVIETGVLMNNVKNDEDFEKIYDICMNGGKWKKWIPEIYHVKRHLDKSSRQHLIEICGHYHNKAIKEIIQMDDEIIKVTLKNKLYELIKLYEHKI